MPALHDGNRLSKPCPSVLSTQETCQFHAEYRHSLQYDIWELRGPSCNNNPVLIAVGGAKQAPRRGAGT